MLGLLQSLNAVVISWVVLDDNYEYGGAKTAK